LAIVFSFVSALIAIAVMMRWLGRASFMPFVIYRICLGAGLLYWVYG
jgi:undecaprenyl-diphosphatase